MPERPDLRKIAADIREALDSYPREALADILTYVFQAYVVEGTPSVAATQPERLTELEGLSFAEVITALQTRLDLPELALFEVNAGRVSLRAGGQTIPVVVERGRAAAMSAPAAAPTPAPAPAEPPPRTPPRPGVTVEEVPSSQLRPPRPAAAPAAPAEAPPPRRGLSIGAASAGPRPASGAATPPAGASGSAQPQQPVAPTQPAAAKKQPGDEPADDSAQSKRFSLLDID